MLYPPNTLHNQSVKFCLIRRVRFVFEHMMLSYNNVSLKPQTLAEPYHSIGTIWYSLHFQALDEGGPSAGYGGTDDAMGPRLVLDGAGSVGPDVALFLARYGNGCDKCWQSVSAHREHSHLRLVSYKYFSSTANAMVWPTCLTISVSTRGRGGRFHAWTVLWSQNCL